MSYSIGSSVRNVICGLNFIGFSDINLVYKGVFPHKELNMINFMLRRKKMFLLFFDLQWKESLLLVFF